MNPFKNLLLIIPIAIAAWTTKKNDENINVQTINISAISNDVKLIDVWYEYVGPVPSTSADLNNPANYVKFVPQPANIKVMCPYARDLCAVKFPDNGTNPIQENVTARQTEIQAVISTRVETAAIELCFCDFD